MTTIWGRDKDFTVIKAPNKNIIPFKKPLLNCHNQCLITEDNGKKEQTSAWGFNRDHFCLHMTGLTFVAMHNSKVQRHGWENTFKTHPHAKTHFSTTTRKRGRGKQKVIIFTTVSFLLILIIITHIHLIFQQHIPPPTLPGWTTIHCSLKPTVGLIIQIFGQICR